jgi:hypothetical protein
MTILNFTDKDNFLEYLDGKVYCIADETNSKFLCDVSEEDYDVFHEEGKIIDLMRTDSDEYSFVKHFSDCFLSSKEYTQEVLSRAVSIKINVDVSDFAS